MDGIRLLKSLADRRPAHGGGRLVRLQAGPARARELKAAARDLLSHDLTPRQVCDLELLATGAFSPLEGFMGRTDYESVCQDGRLADGRLWPVPVTLDVPPALAERLSAGGQLALRDDEGALLAVLTIEELWERDLRREADQIYGTAHPGHPEVSRLLAGSPVCVAGRLEVVEPPLHDDFITLRRTPAELRRVFAEHGPTHLLAYFPRHLLHRAHVEFTRRAAMLHDARLLILADVGRRGPEDEGGHYARARALHAALASYPPDFAMLNLIELSPRRCGARAALLHAILARNFGCTHLVVEHDYADQGGNANGEPLYGQYRCQETVIAHEREIGIETVLFRDLVYEEDHPEHFLVRRPLPWRAADSAGAARAYERAAEIARWFSYPDVLREWQKPFHGRPEQGLTVFFTGLSGAGKSAIARCLAARLMEIGERHVTLLDGDVVRKHLSSELGFSREHRDLNVLRLGYVASLITQHRGVAICAPIAPYAAARAKVRAMVEPYGGFVEVYVSTPIEVCEARDRKGLYARARAGLIQGFTGVSDPYEPPASAEIVIDTTTISVRAAAERILAYLTAAGYLSGTILAAAEGTRPLRIAPPEIGPAVPGHLQRDEAGKDFLDA